METGSRVLEDPSLSPPSYTTRLVIQFISLVLGALSIVLCSASLHHDVVWNRWVDIRFNLNRRNPMFREEVLDYLDFASQQDWINIVSKQLFLDKAALGMIVIVVILMASYILSCSYTKPVADFGGALYMFCAVGLLLSGFIVIASIIISEKKETEVSEYIDKALKSRKSASQPILFVNKLVAEVVCPSEQPSWIDVLQQCQLTVPKLILLLFLLMSVVLSLYLSFSFLNAKERCCSGSGDRLLDSPSTMVLIRDRDPSLMDTSSKIWESDRGNKQQHHHHHHHHHHRPHPEEAVDRMNDRDKVFHPSIYETIGNNTLTDQSIALRSHKDPMVSSDSLLRRVFYTENNESVMTLAPAYWDERVLDKEDEEDPSFVSILDKSMSGINARANATRVQHDTIRANQAKPQHHHDHPYQPHYHG